MAVELTRVSRLYVEIDVAATLPGGGSATISGVDVALLPIGAGPDASTSWTAATYASGTATVLLAGPDAGGSGAIVVPSAADLWAKVTDAPEIDAAKVTRVSVKGGTPAVLPISTVSDAYVAGLVGGDTATQDALDARFVNEGQGAGGALSGSYPSPGLNETTVDSIVAGKIPGPSSTATALQADFAPLRGALFAPPQVPIRVVSTCDSGWTQLDATVTHDATIFDAGAGSLKLTAPASNKAQAQLTFSAQDWSTSAFGIRMRFDDRASVSDGYILLSTSGTFTQYFRAQYTPKLSTVTNNEWFEFTLTRDDFDFNSGTANWSTVNGIRVQVYSGSSATPSLWVDQIIRYPTPPRPTISICFDDGFATTATVAKPKLDQYGYRGSAFFIAQRLGQNGYMNQTQVDTLAQAGWDICGHGDTNLTTLSLAAAEADVKANKQYLVEHGYKGGDVYAYPNDGQNFAIRTMVAKYFNAARGLSTFGQTRAYVPRRRFQGYQAGTARTVATIQAWLAAGIATNSWMVLTFHNLPNSTSLPEDYLPADFNSVIDYIAGAGVQVLPVSEALAAADSPPILRAPNGSQYRLDVDNTGALVTSLI